MLLPMPGFVPPLAQRGRWNFTADESSSHSAVGTFQRDLSPTPSYTVSRGASAAPGAERGSFGKRKEPAPFPKPQRWGLCSVCPNATARSGPAVAPKFLGGRRTPETPLGEGTVPGPLHILERTGRNSSGTTRHVGLRNEGRHTWLLVVHGRGSPSALKGPSRGRTRPGGITLGPPRGRTGPRPSLWAPPEAGPGWGCHSEPPGVSLLLQVLPQVLLPLLLHHLVELHGGSGVLH